MAVCLINGITVASTCLSNPFPACDSTQLVASYRSVLWFSQILKSRFSRQMCCTCFVMVNTTFQPSLHLAQPVYWAKTEVSTHLLHTFMYKSQNSPSKTYSHILLYLVNKQNNMEYSSTSLCPTWVWAQQLEISAVSCKWTRKHGLRHHFIVSHISLGPAMGDICQRIQCHLC